LRRPFGVSGVGRERTLLLRRLSGFSASRPLQERFSWRRLQPNRRLFAPMPARFRAHSSGSGEATNRPDEAELSRLAGGERRCGHWRPHPRAARRRFSRSPIGRRSSGRSGSGATSRSSCARWTTTAGSLIGGILSSSGPAAPLISRSWSTTPANGRSNPRSPKIAPPEWARGFRWGRHRP
jgi:hypothetical protein